MKWLLIMVSLPFSAFGQDSAIHAGNFFDSIHSKAGILISFSAHQPHKGFTESLVLLSALLFMGAAGITFWSISRLIQNQSALKRGELKDKIKLTLISIYAEMIAEVYKEQNNSFEKIVNQVCPSNHYLQKEMELKATLSVFLKPIHQVSRFNMVLDLYKYTQLRNSKEISEWLSQLNTAFIKIMQVG